MTDIDVLHSRGERLRTNGAQKLRDDMVKASDLLSGDLNRLAEFLSGSWRAVS